MSRPKALRALEAAAARLTAPARVEAAGAHSSLPPPRRLITAARQPTGIAAPAELVSLRGFCRAPLAPRAPRHASHAAAAAAAAAADAAAAGGTALLDGRATAAAWQAELAARAAAVRARAGRPPGLGVLWVGGRPDSAVYVERKREACAAVGVAERVVRLPASAALDEVRAAVRALCADPALDGVLVQLPLPPGVDEEAVIEAFDPAKDVDGFHPLNVGRTLMRGRAARFVPCTALGALELLRRGGAPLAGRSVAIVGDSNIVGMPLAMLFRDAGAANVTVVHRSSYGELFADGRRWAAPAPPAAAAGGGGGAAAAAAAAAAARAAAAACAPRLPGPARPYAVSYSSGLRAAYDAGDAAAAAGPAAAAAAAAPRPPASASHRTTATVASPALLAAGAPPPPPDLAELAGLTATADILVVAVGYPHLVRRHWIKRGAWVVDVGINVVDWGAGPAPLHVVGDVDPAEARAAGAAALSPVPGGVGPMTVAALLANTLRAAEANVGLAPM
jgi:5,10-methylene-tetrahydrofolate dehydrogenase/methenyl tetrahydrofolate cyclohydrolase